MKKLNHNIFELPFFSKNRLKLKSLGLLGLIMIFSSCNQGTITKTNTPISSTFDLQTKSNIVITEGDLDKIYYKDLKVSSILLPETIKYTDLKQDSVLIASKLEEINKLDINGKILIDPYVKYLNGATDINLSYKISDPSVISIEQNFPQVSVVALKSGKATLEIYSNYDPTIKTILFFEVSNNIKPKEDSYSNSEKVFTSYYPIIPEDYTQKVNTYYDYFFLDKPEYMWSSGATVSCSISKNIAYTAPVYDYYKKLDKDSYSNLHYANKTIIIPPFLLLDWNLEGNKGIFVDLLKNNVNIIDTKTNKVKILSFKNREISHTVWIDDNKFAFIEIKDKKNTVKLFDINTLSEKEIITTDENDRIINLYYSTTLNTIITYYSHYNKDSENHLYTYTTKTINLSNKESKTLSSICLSQKMFFNKNNSFFYLAEDMDNFKSIGNFYLVDIDNLSPKKIDTGIIDPNKLVKYGMAFSLDGEQIVFNKNEYLMIADKYLTNSHQVVEANRNIEAFCN